MIANPALGFGALLDLTISGKSVNYDSMTSVTLEFDENQHDLLSIRLSGLPTRAVTDYRGAPVLLTVSTGVNYTMSFTGYVEEVRPIVETRHGLIDHSPIQDAMLICLGVSYSMRGARTRIWERHSVTDIAIELADRYEFSLSAPPTSVVKERLLQKEESDFAFLSRVVKDHGLAMSVHGTHIDIWDAYDALERRKGLFRLQNMNEVAKKPELAPGQITKFKGSFGRKASDGAYKGTSVTVLEPNGTTFNVNANNVLGIANPDYPDRKSMMVGSYAEAERIIVAGLRGAYDYEATVETTGIAGATPGTVVQVTGFNTDYDGFWYVRSAKHTITTGLFATELGIVRNVEPHFSRSTVEHYRTPPTPLYVNGKWRASRLRTPTYAAL